ncbi:MAG: hypothetical protein ACPG4O_01895 [bacterium]
MAGIHYGFNRHHRKGDVPNQLESPPASVVSCYFLFTINTHRSQLDGEFNHAPTVLHQFQNLPVNLYSLADWRHSVRCRFYGP